MTETERPPIAPAPPDDDHRVLSEMKTELRQVEAEQLALRGELKALRVLLERVIEHRQRSHTELVLLLTNLVSKLPIGDVGVIVSKLVEHNSNLVEYCGALAKGKMDGHIPQPALLKTLDQTRKDLGSAIKPIVQDLITLGAPFEPVLLQGVLEKPDRFFSPQMIRANRCFIKNHVPRERILREFGEPALPLFNDMTTDPKLNPRPKADEIALSFKSDFETLLAQAAALPEEKRQALRVLHGQVQKSRPASEEGRAQRNAFLRLSFLSELLNYYEHESTQAPDVIFAQRLPAVVEQLVPPGADENLEEKLILGVEAMMVYVINPDHRLMVINNIGKSGGPATMLKYVLKLRYGKGPDIDHTPIEFVRYLLQPPPARPPSVERLLAVLRLLGSEMQRSVVRSIFHCDRIRKDDAQALGKALAAQLNLKDVDPGAANLAVPPEMERQQAWGKIQDMIHQRRDAREIAAAIRDRLHARYDGEEIRQSWLTLIEADAMSLIRIFNQLPYLENGKTDTIARTILETYVSRLTHEKYAGIHNKIVTSLKNMYKVKPDSPTMLTFLALVRWVSPEAAEKISADAGVPAAA